MKRTLSILGAGALFLWTGLGLVAWSSVAQRMTAESTQNDAEEEALRFSALTEELGTLHQDVRALAAALGENLQALNDSVLASQGENAATLGLQVAALRDEVGSRDDSPSSDELSDLMRGLDALRDALVSATSVPAAQPVSPDPESPSQVAQEPAPEPERAQPAEETTTVAETAAPAAKARKSFLAFKLPSDDFRFDERRTWTVLPALSRVGFDAKTTLHDFTATTSNLEGQLEADLSHPNDKASAHIRVRATTLDSGNESRDEEMDEHLAVDEHEFITFELTGFEPAEIDGEKMTASGEVSGRMSLRGVTREVTMPIRIAIDEARRLCIEGEMPLDLTRFDVPVPNKLGLVSMEKEVRVWISLRLRGQTRTEG